MMRPKKKKLYLQEVPERRSGVQKGRGTSLQLNLNTEYRSNTTKQSVLYIGLLL